MGENALVVKDVVKEYKLYDKQIDRLKEAFSPFKKEYHKKYYALDGISFSVKKGEKIGIIGSNGAGKSTLLKILTGVLNITSGEIQINGKIAALLELGAGFNSDYTGMENIYLNGTLMGYSEEQINAKVDQIVEFADIGDFINQPVKCYSSGMFVRLAFATQIFSDPDILIVDEALSVGDIRFQQKCFRAMESIMNDKTVVLVTHDTAAVTRFCNRVIWINKGKKVYDGEVTEGLRQYQGFLVDQAIEEKGNCGDADYVEATETNVETKVSESLDDIPEVITTCEPKGTLDAVITHCGLKSEKGIYVEEVEPKQNMTFAMKVDYKKEIVHPICGLTIRDRLGNVVIGINSETLGYELPKANGVITYKINFQLPQLNKGEYTITPAIANGYQNDHIQLCWLDDACIFKITNRKCDIPGFIYIDNGSIEIEKQ